MGGGGDPHISLPPPPPYTKRSSLVTTPQQPAPPKKRKYGKTYGITSSGTFSQKQLCHEMMADLQDCCLDDNAGNNRAAVVKERQKVWERRLQVQRQEYGVTPTNEVVKKVFHKARTALAQQQQETSSGGTENNKSHASTTTPTKAAGPSSPTSSSPINSIYKRSPIPNANLEPFLKDFDSIGRSHIQSMINLCSDKIRRLPTIEDESIVQNCLKEAKHQAKEVHKSMPKADRKRFWSCAKRCCMAMYDLSSSAKKEHAQKNDHDDRNDTTSRATMVKTEQQQKAIAEKDNQRKAANLTEALFQQASQDIMKKLLRDRSVPLQSLLEEHEDRWKQRYLTDIQPYDKEMTSPAAKKDKAQAFWLRVCKRCEVDYAQALSTLEPMNWDFFFVGKGSSLEKTTRYLSHADWTLLPLTMDEQEVVDI